MTNFNLDLPLIQLSGTGASTSNWTVRNAVEGVQIFGGIGSGKTSGSGRMIALKFLSTGFGGLVLTVKPNEKQEWEAYCKLTGRTDDLLVIEPDGGNFFNFLDYESKDGSITDNIVEVLKTVIRASEEKSGGSGDDSFWETALDMLIFNVIDLCKLAYGKVSVQKMYEIVQSLPKPDMPSVNADANNAFKDAFIAAHAALTVEITKWEIGLTTAELSNLKYSCQYDEAVCDAVPEARTYKFVDQFFLETFMNLSEKTRSIIDFTFSGFLFRLMRDPVYSLFCRHASTFTPEDSLTGKIILINLPVKMYQKVGRDCQILFKYIWQRAMEKRDVHKNGRPVFLWADEAQNFLHEHDADYQATARSSRIATVYISQNLPNYYANMGGHRSDFRVKSFLGTLATKIFHANADMDTNRYSSELIGDVAFEEMSSSSSIAGQFSSSKTKSLRIDRIIRPEAFVALKTGGALNSFKVEGFMHIQGNPLQSGLNFTKVQFDQNYLLNLNSN